VDMAAEAEDKRGSLARERQREAISSSYTTSSLSWGAGSQTG